MPEPSDHFDGRAFFNPTGIAPRPLTSLPRMLSTPRAKWPKWIDEAPGVVPPLGSSDANVTFIGHATFLIQAAAGNILTDPMYSMRAGPWNLVGPKRVRAPGIPFAALPPIAMVLLSHNHYDHCDLRTLAKLAKRHDPLVVTPLGNASLVRSTGLRRVEELDWWQSATTTPIPVTMTPARHFSARGIHDRNRALWCGFVIQAGAKRIYFAGDTAYATFFADIPARIGAIDLALLPIGAYEPRWFMSAVHMNPEDAVQAHLDLQSPPSIGMHFGTFQMTSEAIDQPLLDLAQACEARGVSRSRFHTIAVGASATVASNGITLV